MCSDDSTASVVSLGTLAELEDESDNQDMSVRASEHGELPFTETAGLCTAQYNDWKVSNRRLSPALLGGAAWD